MVADVARRVAATQVGSQWRVAVTHPDSGALVWDGTTKRRPSTAQRRHVEARSPTLCLPRVPHAGHPLRHRPCGRPLPGGPTLVKYLNPLCRHDHRLKDAGWKLKSGPDGTTTWTSPLGHDYTTGPDPP